MNKYVFSASEEGELFIHTVKADSYEDALIKIMQYYDSIYNNEIKSEYWDDFIEELETNYYTFIGEIHLLSTLGDKDFEINLE